MVTSKDIAEMLTLLKSSVSKWEEFWNELDGYHTASKDSELVYAIRNHIDLIAQAYEMNTNSGEINPIMDIAIQSAQIEARYGV